MSFRSCAASRERVCVSEMSGENPPCHTPGSLQGPGQPQLLQSQPLLPQWAPGTSSILWAPVKLGVWENLIIWEYIGTFLGSGCCITHVSLILQILRERFLILGHSPLKRYRTACSGWTVMSDTPLARRGGRAPGGAAGVGEPGCAHTFHTASCTCACLTSPTCNISLVLTLPHSQAGPSGVTADQFIALFGIPSISKSTPNFAWVCRERGHSTDGIGTAESLPLVFSSCHSGEILLFSRLTAALALSLHFLLPCQKHKQNVKWASFPLFSMLVHNDATTALLLVSQLLWNW